MQIGCVVLAAGLSSRMGERFKLLLPWVDGRSVLHHVVNRVQRATVAHLVVVTGHRAEDVQQALPNSIGHFVHNPDYATGEILSSLKVGLNALPDDTDGVLVMPGDLPLMKSETVQKVCQAFAPDKIIVPRHDGQRGHPVLFPRAYWPQILALPPDETPRSVIQKNAKSRLWLDVDDVGCITDIDTPAAYERALKLAMEK